MNIAITGGTGFIGEHLTKTLTTRGHHVYILTRNPKKAEENVTYVKWVTDDSAPESSLPDIDAWINLAGKSIFTRWTRKNKDAILTSRIQATREVKRLIEANEKNPAVLIQASAVGIYGTSIENTFTEDSVTSNEDFLSHVSHKWEEEARQIESLGIRTVYTRFGIVLGANGGSLPMMKLPYIFFGGGPIGSGKQWLSWIHVDDACDLIMNAISRQDISGPLNITSPNPIEMNELGRSIGSAMRRPHWLKAPAPLIQLALGEMSMMILKGQRVLPKKALLQDYNYNFPHINEALDNLIQS
ncbi:TIGR01777 family oxidoreductase [Bacillus gobiensis]|uniref:TIGR01777 family oxidoreductase n=1 Tax=Bacillus gobiensis TaxID=1441095 RepID=UPI003D1C2F5C